MELMVNNSLASKINKLDDFQIWKYFRNLICGVEHCHEIGKIVHRDINVNNLLINEQNILKLSDFGVSIVIDENNDLIPINSGPTTYTPPEKKGLEKVHYNGKPADMWCCGVTLFHMIFKTAPFIKNGAQEEPDSSYFII
jgi:serine/threonine protein kinase